MGNNIALDSISVSNIMITNIARAISGHARLFSTHTPVQKIMSSPVISINPNSSIRNAMETMQQEDIHILPVVDTGTKILEITTKNDILRAIVQNQILLSTFANDQVLVDTRQSVWYKFTDCWLRSNIHTDHDDEFLMIGNYRKDNKRNNFL
ncbi:MAG TPA: CBS domain-containing protein [Nitrososphaeraceae archaeon]|jgi:predicted transcriptional regulator